MRCEDRQSGLVWAPAGVGGMRSPAGSGLAPRVGRTVLHAEERPTGLGRAARSQPEPPWILWASAEPFWTRLSLSVEVPRGVRQAGGVGLPSHPGAVGRSLSPAAGKRPLSRIAGGLAYLGYRSDLPGPRAAPGSERSRAGAPDLLIPALPSAKRALCSQVEGQAPAASAAILPDLNFTSRGLRKLWLQMMQ